MILIMQSVEPTMILSTLWLIINEVEGDSTSQDLICLPFSTSHIIISVFEVAETNFNESGVNFKETMELLHPLKILINFNDCISHKHIRQSWPPVAIKVPSCESAKHKTSELCPSKKGSFFLADHSKEMMVLFLEAQKIFDKLWVIAIDLIFSVCSWIANISLYVSKFHIWTAPSGPP